MDVADIAPGLDFRRVLEQQVTSCCAPLAISGKSWLDSAGADGARRLDDPGDFVRVEIASALRRDIPVIPVLIQGAQMPTADHLPDDLSELAYRNPVKAALAPLGLRCSHSLQSPRGPYRTKSRYCDERRPNRGAEFPEAQTNTDLEGARRDCDRGWCGRFLRFENL